MMIVLNEDMIKFKPHAKYRNKAITKISQPGRKPLVSVNSQAP